MRFDPATARSFVTAEYLPAASDDLEPRLPVRCPEWADDGLPCFIVVKEWCERKAGPGHLILRCVCYAHGGFRVYPTGWWPYGRVGLLGERNSLISAVRDSTEGRRWPEETAVGTRRTQTRWTTTWCRLFAVEPELSDDARLRAALTLGVSTLMLRDKANEIRAGPTSKGGRALVVMGILKSLDPVGLLQRLFRRGHERGLWGRPIFESGVIASLSNITKA